MPERTLTDVPGLTVGHATLRDANGTPRTGCTVVLGPFRGAVELRGMGTGTREMAVLEPEHLVPRVDGVLFTGGSAFGLAAADGVMAWLRERGLGYDAGSARIPIVPAAVIYDLWEDEGASEKEAPGGAAPDAAMGRAACDDASRGPVEQGRVGAGAGATVAKLAGMEGASPGGVGSAARTAGPWTVGALAVVNALGEVRNAEGGVVAGARGPDGEVQTPGELARAILADGPDGGAGLPGSNTTLCLVATDAPLDAVGLRRLARVAANALPRRIHPVNTPFDGDVVMAVSTAEESREMAPGRLLALATLAQEALEQALTRGVVEGRREPAAPGT